MKICVDVCCISAKERTCVFMHVCLAYSQEHTDVLVLLSTGILRIYIYIFFFFFLISVMPFDFQDLISLTRD